MKPRQPKRKKRGFFCHPAASLQGFALFIGASGLLLLLSGLHMTLAGDPTAYATRLTLQGTRRDDVSPAFLYIVGTAMLAGSIALVFPKKKKPR